MIIFTVIELDGVKSTNLIRTRRTWLADRVTDYTTCAFDLFTLLDCKQSLMWCVRHCDHIVSHNQKI